MNNYCGYLYAKESRYCLEQAEFKVNEKTYCEFHYLDLPKFNPELRIYLVNTLFSGYLIYNKKTLDLIFKFENGEKVSINKTMVLNSEIHEDFNDISLLLWLGLTIFDDKNIPLSINIRQVKDINLLKEYIKNE